MRSREGLESGKTEEWQEKSVNEATVALHNGQQGELQPILHLTLPR